MARRSYARTERRGEVPPFRLCASMTFTSKT